MFRPTFPERTNCYYDTQPKNQSVEADAEYWKKEAEKWKTIAEARGYKPDKERLDELEKRMNRAERWITELIHKTRLID